jgi:membrane fusion protein (multidrug efflux system)
VQVGQPLFAVVADEQPWVVANFKETQLKKMRVGQPALIEVDAYPKVEFHGRVDSFSPATGAKFALLPPDNATGNFTKVVQRVPVKIVFTDKPDPSRPLRAGMSVNAIVTTE